AATATVTITASASTCPWTLTHGVPWISAGATGGTGSGQVPLSFAANAGEKPRSGVVNVAGHPVQVTQAGTAPGPDPKPDPKPDPNPACTFAVAPMAVTIPAEGGAGEVSVAASTPDCAWTASSSAPWLTLPGPTAGRGDGRVPF